jgi:hypothetical protein
VFSIIAFLAVVAAVAYEVFQSLNRFASLTRDDIPKAEEQDADPNLRVSLLL